MNISACLASADVLDVLRVAGGMNISACLACAAGYFCEDTGIAVIATYACAPGYYCPEGTSAPIPCPAGTYR